jgi:hypothetical protein
VLDNRIQGYVIGGITMTWPLSGFYLLKNERASIDLAKNEIDLREETFVFNTKIQTLQEDGEIAKYKELISTDDAIIKLREQIKQTALAQMENGVMTTTEYLHEVHSAHHAQLSKLVHETQLLLMQHKQQNTIGH